MARAAFQKRARTQRPGDRHHLVERGSNETGQSDHVCLIIVGGLEDVLPGHHHSKIDHLKSVALKNDPDDVLADIVNVAFDSCHHDPAFALGHAVLFFFLFDEGDEVSDRPFHHARRFDDLWKEHLARPEQVADDIHAIHQRTFNYLDRARELKAGFFSIVHDVRIDTLDESVRETLRHRKRAPFCSRLFGRCIGAFETLGNFDQPFG